MTQIVARSSASFSDMITDRLLTTDPADPWDEDANKNLLFGAKNALVSLAYTGLAHIGFTPTDQWIAQCLTTGRTFPKGRRPGTVPAFIPTDSPSEYLGVSLRKLRARLESTGSELEVPQRKKWTADPFEIVVSGFEWHHGKEVRPVLLGVSNPSGSDKFQIVEFQKQGRRSGRWPVLVIAAPDTELSKAVLDSAGRQTRAFVQAGLSGEQLAEAFQRVCADAIREASLTPQSRVGPDLMSISISAPTTTTPVVKVRYLTTNRDRGVLVSKDAQMPVRVAFTPWIISPGFVESPCVFTGNNSSSCGAYVVQMTPATDEGGGPLLAISSQPRRRP